MNVSRFVFIVLLSLPCYQIFNVAHANGPSTLSYMHKGDNNSYSSLRKGVVARNVGSLSNNTTVPHKKSDEFVDTISKSGGPNSSVDIPKTNADLSYVSSNDEYSSNGDKHVKPSLKHISSGGSSVSKFLLSWTQTVPYVSGRVLTLVPAITDDGTVIVSSSNGRVRAFSILSGSNKWGIDLPDLSAGVSANGDLCFVVSNTGTVYAISIHNGHIVWRNSLGETITSLPVVDGGRLFLRAINGSVFSLDRSTGETIWTFSGTQTRDLLVRDSAPLTIYASYIFVPSPQGQLFILDKHTGHLNTSLILFPAQGIDDVERMTDLVGDVFYLDNDTVCVASFRHAVGCYKLKERNFSWVSNISSLYGGVFRDRNIFFSSDDGVVHSFDLESGNQLWKSEFLGDTLITKPALFKGYLLVGDRSAHMNILDSTTGLLVRRLQFSRSTSFVSAPSVWRDYIVAISQDGHVFCIHYVS